MPLGAFRINSLAKFTVTAVAEVIRRKVGVTAAGDAKVSTAQSKFGGSSAYWNNLNGYLIIPASSAVDLSGDFTFETWVYTLTTDGNFRAVWDNRNTSGSVLADSILIDTRSGGWRVFIDGTDRSSDTLSINTWYHIALVRNGTNFKWYIDGVEKFSYNSGSVKNFTANYDMWIGNKKSLPTNFWYGYMDEIRISNTARYTANFTPPSGPFVNDSNTLLLLHMDGTDGSTYFEDDNGVRAKIGVIAVGDAKISTIQSKFGGASAYFDGTGDYLAIENIPGFIASDTDITSECWVYFPTTVPINRGIIQLGTVSPTQSNNGTLTMVVNGTGGWRVQANNTTTNVSASVSADTWYHVALVKNADTTKFYVNGQNLLTLTTDNTAYTTTDSITIGGYWSTSFLMTGYVDEVRISTLSRYTANFTPPTAPFVNDSNTLLLIHADGTDGSTDFTDDNGVRDKKGVIAQGNAQVSTAQIKFGGGSALFDGSGDYLELPTELPSSIGTGDFTIEAWLYQPSIDGIEDIYSAFTNASGSTITILFRVQSTGAIRFRCGVGNTTNLITSATISANTWNHVAAVRSNGTMNVFINGVKDSVSRAENPVDLTGFINSFIGASVINGSYNYYSGYIDEFRFSNTARYTANFTPPTEPFVNDANTLLLLHMDGTDGSTVFLDDNGVIPFTP